MDDMDSDKRDLPRFEPGHGVARAVLVTIGNLTDSEVAILSRDLAGKLSLSTLYSKDGVSIEHGAAARALMEAPQHYIDAVRVLTATRMCLARVVSERENFMASARRAVEKKLADDGNKRPQRGQIDDMVRCWKQTQVTDLDNRVSEAEIAVDIAKSLVRAWDPANRETTIRRLLEESR